MVEALVVQAETCAVHAPALNQVVGLSGFCRPLAIHHDSGNPRTGHECAVQPIRSADPGTVGAQEIARPNCAEACHIPTLLRAGRRQQRRLAVIVLLSEANTAGRLCTVKQCVANRRIVKPHRAARNIRLSARFDVAADAKLPFALPRICEHARVERLCVQAHAVAPAMPGHKTGCRVVEITGQSRGAAVDKKTPHPAFIGQVQS